jgi:hypothetical protein
MKIVELFGETYKVSDYDMVVFDDKKVVATALVPKQLTANDIDNIICTAIEGGIGYWARTHRKLMEWDVKPTNMCVSEYLTIRLLSGKSVYFVDSELELEDVWELTLDKLVKGYAQNCNERPHDCDLEQGDATTCDCIIQYALFGELVYG